MSLKKNDIIRVAIDRLNPDGEAIAFYEDKKIILQGLLPGETADVKIIKTGKNVNFAKVFDIIQKSTDRITPACENTACKVCEILFSSYDSQLGIKSSLISAIFDRKISVESSEPFGYRNKIILPVQRLNGKIQIGTYRKNSHEVTDWNFDCIVITDQMNKIIQKAKMLIGKNDGEGNIEQLFIRGGSGGYQTGFIVKKEDYSLLEILRNLNESGLNIVSTFYSISSGTNSVMIKNPVYVSGQNYCSLTTLNSTYKVSPESFFQANIFTLDKIILKIKNVLKTETDPKILDLYSGCGVLSDFPGIRRTCIESNQSSFDFVEKSSDSEFLTSDVSGVIDEIISGGYNIIVSDPPRKGMDVKTLSAIDNSTANTLIYLSCEPKNQKRDIDLLKNFRVAEIIGYDMFPNTMQIESLAILKRI